MAKTQATDWRHGTKRWVIAKLAEGNYTKRQAFDSLRPVVEEQRKPMIFSANVGGHRVPKAMHEQLIELKNEIGRVYALLGKATSADFDSEEIDVSGVPEIEETEDDDTEESETNKPIAKGKKSVKDELVYFLRRVRQVRQFCKERAERSEPIDSISMRPALAGSKLIPAGIPADALLDVMTIHWPKDTRNDAGIRPYDFTRLSRQICEEREIDMTGKHELFGYVLTLCEERIPVMLVGPMGSGKSVIASQIAEYLALPYGETAMSAGATRGDLLGRLTASQDKPFILSKFCELYAGGGIFNFEEIDAALPEVLITLNNALSGERLFNSSNGEEYAKHPDFIPISTANTWGLGANREYVARERLDAATVDRWRMGRVFVPVDEKIEEGILYGRI